MLIIFSKYTHSRDHLKTLTPPSALWNVPKLKEESLAITISHKTTSAQWVQSWILQYPPGKRSTQGKKKSDYCWNNEIPTLWVRRMITKMRRSNPVVPVPNRKTYGARRSIWSKLSRKAWNQSGISSGWTSTSTLRICDTGLSWANFGRHLHVPHWSWIGWKRRGDFGQDQLFSEDDLLRAVNFLQNRKESGPDGILAEVLKSRLGVATSAEELG